MPDLFERLKSALADRYAIEREIGRGGMAVVFLAQDIKHDRAVAVKVFEPEFASSIGSERFLREIRVTAQLNHPNILPLYDSGEIDGFLYYVMPYVPGESLRHKLDKEKQLPIDEALRIARDAADAIGHAHDLGIVHRDLKPANILLSSGRAVVADFGIARAVSAAAEGKLTQTGLAIGTSTYMSPEQASGETELDGRSDIYSLGCITYEMLGGDPPFTGVTPQAVLARKSLKTVPPLRNVRETVPAGLELIVKKCLAKVPADRFQTALELAEALEDPTIFEQGRPKRFLALGQPVRTALGKVGVVVAIIALGAFAWWVVEQSMGQRDASVDSLALLPIKLDADTVAMPLLGVLSPVLHNRIKRATGLRIPPYESMERYRNTDKSMTEIGEELDVDLLVRVVVYSGPRGSLRAVTELIEARTGEELWGTISLGTYVDGIWGLTEDIVMSLSEQLVLRDTSFSFYRPDPGAYNEYLLSWADDKEKQVEHLERAVSIDSSFALAYADLANIYRFRGTWWKDTIVASEAMRRARSAAERAIELDSTLAQGHTELGYVQYLHDWDWDAALTSAERAGDEGLFLKAQVLNTLGRHQEAMSSIEQYIRWNPLSGWDEYYFIAITAGRLQEARRGYEALVAGRNATPLMSFVHGLELVREGAYEEAGDSMLAGGQPLRAAVAYARARKPARALAVLDSTMAVMDVEPVIVAQVYAELGDTTSVIEWMERGNRERDYSLVLAQLNRSSPPTEHYGLYSALWEMRTHDRIRPIVDALNLPTP